ncbi:MAG: 4Fe-4S dicluster domain-containing protein [Bacillota bacterium]|nr:4Fe-4S dicluster domain-containing protein [Eubacteriales bacterium]
MATKLSPDSVGMLIDITRCIGCRGCQTACKNWNDMPATPTTFTNTWTNPPTMTGTNLTVVNFNIIEKDDGSVMWRSVKEACFHCNEPACESACFVHAFVKTEWGPVVYDPTICVGCRYCMLACPFQIPKYIFPEVKKCHLCGERLAMGLEPACATACPTDAIMFGKRTDLLKEAKARIAANPDKFVNHIYGEHEVGGTSILYISDVPFKDLGFKGLHRWRDIPQYTWDVLKWTPHIAIGWTAMLTAFYVYTKRRSENDDGN